LGQFFYTDLPSPIFNLEKALVRMHMPRYSKYCLTSGCFFAFFAFGFIDNLKGPVLPELIKDQGLSLSQGGNILFAAYLGFIVATFITGIAADTIGNRRILFVAGVLMSIGLVGISLINSLAILFLMMFVLGLGLGAIEVSANGLIVELHPDDSGRFLNLLATFHGTGSFLVPLVVARQLTANVGWRMVFLSAVLLSGTLAVAFAFVSGRNPRRQTINLDLSWMKLIRIGFAGEMIWYYVLICSYVAVELGVAAWLMEYLQSVRGQTTSQSSYYLSGFFAMIMLGRFLGSFCCGATWLSSRCGCLAFGGWCEFTCRNLGPRFMRCCIADFGSFFLDRFPDYCSTCDRIAQGEQRMVFGLVVYFWRYRRSLGTLDGGSGWANVWSGGRAMFDGRLLCDSVLDCLAFAR